MDTAIATEERALVEGIREIASANDGMSVLCSGDYELAGGSLKELKAKEKLVLDWFAPLVKAAHKAHKELKERENETLKPLVETRKMIGAEMGRYHRKCEEEDRQEREIARVAEQEAANADAEKRAQDLEAQGLPVLADTARENVAIVEPITESTAPKVAGTRRTTTWKYEIVDESEIPLQFRCVDEKAIAAMVRVRKGSTSIAGVRVYSVTNVS